MISMWEPLVQAMASFQTSSCEDKLGLVRQLEAGASLHPQHSLVTGDTPFAADNNHTIPAGAGPEAGGG